MPVSSLLRKIAMMVVLPGSLALAAFGASASVVPVSRASGGTASFAMATSQVLNYIFPLDSGEYLTIPNTQYLQYFLWRPLYWYGSATSPAVNYKLSVGNEPTFSNGGKTVTVTLKHYVWSDGTPVTSRDVEFWENLVTANKAEWGDYTPGQYPDNVVSVSYPSAYAFTLTFNKAYSNNWIINDELSQISPLPQQVWDKTSVGGSVGNYDLTSAGAQQVYQFLNSQSLSLTTWTTNPLWSVVDGPWRLSTFAPTVGSATFVPNSTYAGPVKATLSQFDVDAVTSDAAELNELLSGDITYGYVPLTDISVEKQLTSDGYSAYPWPAWGIDFAPYNFTNPTTGPVLKQLYVRQAIQHLVNQEGYIKAFLHGYGSPDYGPVVTVPKNPWVSGSSFKNPYPYSPSASKTLLSSHGWTVVPSGVDSCAHPGTASGECGAGIAKGTKLQIGIRIESGASVAVEEAQALESAMSTVGIRLVITETTHASIFGTMAPCSTSDPATCTWDLQWWGDGGQDWTYASNFYPTLGVIFGTGGSFNNGGYSSKTADSLIAKTLVSNGVGALRAYNAYLAKELPVLWLPTGSAQVSEISNKLQGAVPQNSNLYITPESWRLKS